MIDCNFKLNDNSVWECIYCGWVYLKQSPEPPRRNCHGSLTPEQVAIQKAKRDRYKWQSKHGPGAHLHQLIKTLTGQGITEACKCKSRIAQMNTRGPAWCRDNTETIVDWLIEEVDRRLKAAQDADEPAGWRLRLGGIDLPGRRFALRQMILRAVRMAERDAQRVRR